MRIVGVVSAHAAGATSIATGLAGVLTGQARVLLADLNPELAQVAALLDVDDRANAFHLAYEARLEAVTAATLEDRVRWHESLAVLPGPADPEQAREVRDHFVKGLLDAAAGRYAWTVVDLGRVRPQLYEAATSDTVLWVVTPSPLGLAAFDRRFRQLMAAEAAWLARVRAVVNQAADDSLAGVAEFLEREYGVPVAGSVPHEPGFWRGLEISHSVQPFSSEICDEDRFVSWFGRPALRVRRAIEGVVRQIEQSAVVPARTGTET